MDRITLIWYAGPSHKQKLNAVKFIFSKY